MKVEGEHIAEEHLSQPLVSTRINCLFVALRRQATIREITSTGPNGHCRTPTIMNLGMYTVCTQSQVNCAMKCAMLRR
jgi:adenine C2-methylase RlmN of 23S rRNA A2503 and tRNA A37